MVEAITLKLTEFPVIENLRLVLEKCNQVRDVDERLTTPYVGSVVQLQHTMGCGSGSVAMDGGALWAAPISRCGVMTGISSWLVR